MDDTSSVLDTLSHSELIWTVIVDWDRICRSRRVDFRFQTLKYWAFDSGSLIKTRQGVLIDIAFRHAHTLGRIL